MKLYEKLIKNQVVYTGPYLRAERHLVLLPDGQKAIRDIVRPPDAVAIVALDDGGNLYLVKQYRPAIRRITYELPAGIIDPGERPIVTARRECEEEIGMRPRVLKKLCTVYHAVGFSTGSIRIYLAKGLKPVRSRYHDPTEFLKVVTIPFEEAYEMTLKNRIIDAQSLIGILWAKQLLF